MLGGSSTVIAAVVEISGASRIDPLPPRRQFSDENPRFSPYNPALNTHNLRDGLTFTNWACARDTVPGCAFDMGPTPIFRRFTGL
jgi:hypothetical protein